ncbi:DUF1150 domain-containing protein [Bombella saccharophila]|uniref:DUF1150 domain-containing protein n=1 Tax=Bombella saccharophila TaxID=2967338 RepID=A0ABT3W4D3_9PROT|nr:DUF1150 domain-containing protein [Bombella saccharophila]MCX5613912.1 DUF1150 domain-containing protein [Bombella saccharophila]
MGESKKGTSALAVVEAMQDRARAMTGTELRNWGLTEIAYLRQISYEGASIVAIYAADGTPVAIAEDEASAVDAILEQDMVPTFLQ